MPSKVMFGTYNYNILPPRGDVGTAIYDGATTITPHPGVAETYNGGANNIGPDPKPFYFENGAGHNRAAVASIEWGVSGAVCTWLVYDADADNASPFEWNAPIITQVPLTIGSTNITNPYRIATRRVNGTTVDIYGIDFDAKIVFCVRSDGTNGDVYTVQPWNYIFPNPFDNTTNPYTYYDSFGVDVEVVGDDVYALFISAQNINNPSTAVYLNSTVVKLTSTLGSPVYMGPHNTTVTAPGGVTWPAKNAFSIQAYGTDLLLTAVGGPQKANDWNPDSRIQKVAQSNLAVTNLLRAASGTGEPATDQLDFRALTFSGSEAFILTGRYNATFTGFSWRLYRTTMSALTSASDDLISDITPLVVTTGSNTPGFLWALLYSVNTSKTWFARGNDLAIYGFNPPPPPPGSVGIVGSAAGIGSLSSLGGGANLNFITIYEDEMPPSVARAMVGYVAPAFASNSVPALIERKKFLAMVSQSK